MWLVWRQDAYTIVLRRRPHIQPLPDNHMELRRFEARRADSTSGSGSGVKLSVAASAEPSFDAIKAEAKHRFKELLASAG